MLQMTSMKRVIRVGLLVLILGIFAGILHGEEESAEKVGTVQAAVDFAGSIEALGPERDEAEDPFFGRPIFRPGSDTGGAGSGAEKFQDICSEPGWICDAECDCFWDACVLSYSSACWQTGCSTDPPCA